MPFLGLRIPTPSSFLRQDKPPAAPYATKYALGDAQTANEQQAKAQAEGHGTAATGSTNSATAIPEDLAASIDQQRGGGSPLPDDTRSHMERTFGRSLSAVRIHDNPQADALNQQLSASAFTVGQDIFFRGGQFRPGSPQGQKLLRHELTHTTQSTQSGLIQRELWTQRAVSDKVGIRGRWRSSAYSEIVGMFGLWHQGVKTQPVSTQRFFLRQLLNKIDAYIQSKQDKQTSATGDAHTARDQRIGKMQDVRDNVQAELTEVEATASQNPETRRPLPARDRGPLNPVQDGLQTGGALNHLFEVELDPSGTDTGLFKPEKDEDNTIAMTKGGRAGIPNQAPNQTGRSVGAYRIAKLLGSDLIPETAYGSVDYTTPSSDGSLLLATQPGSVMKRLHGAQTGTEMDYIGGMPISHTRDEHLRELSKLYLLDMIIGQVDRHGGNYMVEENGSRVWGIDNDLSFGKNYTVDPVKGTTRVSTFGKTGSDITVDPAFATEIIKLANHPDWVEQALQNLDLTDAEIAAALSRLQNLALYLTRRLAKGEKLWT